MPQPFEATDLLQHKTISDLSFSWDQSLAACSVSAVNQVSGQANSTLWIYPANGSAPWQMTSGAAFDNHPRWSPDGLQLAFLSDRAGPTQLFLISRNGGEARQLGSLEGSVSDFEWSPDGRRLLVLVSLRVDPNLRGARAEPHAGEPPENGPQVIWKLPYKADGLGYTLDREIHLFSVNVDSGQARQLTDGAFNVNSARVSPDGRRIVYSRSREGDASHRSDVWIMDVDGSNPRQLTSEHAQVLFPVWSPDGRWLVFSGTLEEGDALVRLWCIALDSGQVQPLGDDSIEIAGEATSVQFAGKDSARVRALLSRRGVQALAEISVPEGQIRWLVQGERPLSQLGVSSEHLIYTAESPVHPMELYCCSHDGSEERCLSDLNPWWRERPKATYQRHAFDVPDGQGGSERVDGWLIRPEGAQGATPLLLDVHGGPASFALFAFGLLGDAVVAGLVHPGAQSRGLVQLWPRVQRAPARPLGAAGPATAAGGGAIAAERRAGQPETGDCREILWRLHVVLGRGAYRHVPGNRSHGRAVADRHPLGQLGQRLLHRSLRD